ncbi:MAG: nicotinamidase [Pyrinomonadaceae bacterium]
MADEKKRALVVVDVQNDFCPGGSLAVEHGDEVVGPLNKLIEEFLERGEPVFKSRDWHPPQTKHFSDYGGTWPIHCVQNTHGAEFHPKLLDDKHIRVISKGLGDEDNYSAFDGTDLALQLQRLRVEEVWVGGLATDYCVKNTVLDALKHGFRVKALKDAMRPVEVQPGDGDRAMDEMRQAGAEIVSASGQPESKFSDPVVEAYLKDIDRTLLRDNLQLTVTQRFERLMSLQQFADDLRAAGKHPTHS